MAKRWRVTATVTRMSLLYSGHDENRTREIVETAGRDHPDWELRLGSEVYPGPGETCITPTGMTDCHGQYIEQRDGQSVCSFCGKPV